MRRPGSSRVTLASQEDLVTRVIHSLAPSLQNRSKRRSSSLSPAFLATHPRQHIARTQALRQTQKSRVFKTSSCRAVNAFAAKCVSKGKTPGIAVGIVQDGKAVLEEDYGMANLEHKVPAKPETVFRIASMTKQFTATGILLLAQERLLSTNDKLSRFFPEFPRSDAITIRQLLTHTSGLSSYDAKPEYRSFRLQSHTISELVNWIKPDPLVAEPGAQYFYSNSGHLLLAGIIEKVSGESFTDFLRARIFDRLGLTSTQVVQDDATLVPNRAAGYVLRDGQLGQSLNAPAFASSNNGGGTSNARPATLDAVIST